MWANSRDWSLAASSWWGMMRMRCHWGWAAYFTGLSSNHYTKYTYCTNTYAVLDRMLFWYFPQVLVKCGITVISWQKSTERWQLLIWCDFIFSCSHVVQLLSVPFSRFPLRQYSARCLTQPVRMSQLIKVRAALFLMLVIYTQGQQVLGISLLRCVHKHWGHVSSFSAPPN